MVFRRRVSVDCTQEGTRPIWFIVDREGSCWRGILVVGYWDMGGMCEPTDATRTVGVAPYEASQFDSSNTI